MLRILALVFLMGTAFAESSNYGVGGYEGFKPPADSFATLPASGNVLGDMRIILSTLDVYVWDGVAWQLRSGSGGGAVSSVFGRAANVTAQVGDYSSFYPQIANNLSDLASIPTAKTNLGIDNLDNTSDANKPISTAAQTALDLKLDLSAYPNIVPNGTVGNYPYESIQTNIRPLQNSPNETHNAVSIQSNIDPDSTGFNLGTAGTYGALLKIGYNHQGTSDIGNTQYISSYSSFGNGTDPITMKGFQYFLGFGNVNSGVTITDSLQGFGLQWNINSGATLSPTSYFNGFYDNNNVNTAVSSYTSFSANPQLTEIRNNSNGTALNINPTVSTLTGNAQYIGIAVGGNYGATSMGASSNVQGISVNPNISNFGAGNYYNGVYSSTSNITGAGTNKWAGYFDGDVNVTGNLSFGGALSIGQLSAYVASTAIDSGGLSPTTFHGLISQITSPNGVTTANFDYLGVNTASLYTAEANSTATSGPLGIGATSLGLPMVIRTETGSNTDNVTGALFAISMDGTSTGGTINQANGGRSVMIPNGITVINRSVGWLAEAPFGTVGTDNWGIYTKDFEKNYFEGDLKVGGADTLSKSHYGIESEKTIASNNGLQAVTSGAQPSCDADHRGLMWNIEGGAGVADIFQICQKNAANNYVWTTH